MIRIVFALVATVTLTIATLAFSQASAPTTSSAPPALSTTDLDRQEAIKELNRKRKARDAEIAKLTTEVKALLKENKEKDAEIAALQAALAQLKKPGAVASGINETTARTIANEQIRKRAVELDGPALAGVRSRLSQVETDVVRLKELEFAQIGAVFKKRHPSLTDDQRAALARNTFNSSNPSERAALSKALEEDIFAVLSDTSTSTAPSAAQ
jgi:Skp family chaperone for outer membrane proteins